MHSEISWVSKLEYSIAYKFYFFGQKSLFTQSQKFRYRKKMSNTAAMYIKSDEDKALSDYVSVSPFIAGGDSEVKRKEMIDYFVNVFDLEEKLFALLKDDSSFYKRYEILFMSHKFNTA